MPGDALRIEIQKILEILPHRYPMVMVDRVTELAPGKHIFARKMVSTNEPWCQGHFPERPIFPGMLIIEALAQSGSLLVYATEPFDPKTNLLYYLGLEKVKFRHTVTPGDQLELRVAILAQRTNVWRLSGEALVDGTVCAQAELLASVVDRE